MGRGALALVVLLTSTIAHGQVKLVDPQAVLRAIGRQHVKPIHAPKSGLWLGIIGDADSARGAFFTSRAEWFGAMRVRRWPIGVRVLGARVVEGQVVLLIEPPRVSSVSSREHAVVIVDVVDSGRMAMTVPPGPSHVDLAGARNIEELSRRVAKARRATGEETPPAVEVALVRRSPTTLIQTISSLGLDVYRARQDAWLEHVALVPSAALAASPWLERVRDIVLDENGTCTWGACSPSSDGSAGVTRPQVVWTQEHGRWVIRALIERALDRVPPPRAPVAATPLVVPPRGDGARTIAAAREQTGALEPTFIAEAPLDDHGGILGVALTYGRPVVVATLEGQDRVLDLESDPWPHIYAPKRVEARFVDLEGDGRTELLLWTDSGGTPARTFAAALRMPPSSIENGPIEHDHGSELALMGAVSVEDALSRLLATPRTGPTPAEACAALGGLEGRAAWNLAAAHDARVLRFSGFLPLTWRPEAVVSGADVTANDLASFGKRCRRLTCLPDGPLCFHPIEDSRDDVGRPLKTWVAGWYWWTREGSKWRVAGFAPMPNGVSVPTLDHPDRPTE